LAASHLLVERIESIISADIARTTTLGEKRKYSEEHKQKPNG
jgi:hypothetical protein